MTSRAIVWLAVLGWGLAVDRERASSAEVVEPVCVSLRPRAILTVRQVTVGDVAELSGGPAGLRDTIRRLDLAEFSREQRDLAVSRKQVEFRLSLSGIPAPLLRVQGARETQVALRLSKLDPERIVAVARETLLKKCPWPAEQLCVDLLQPVGASMPDLGESDHITFRAELQPGAPPPGRVQVNVQVHVQGERRLSLALYFNVRVCQKVPVCLQRVDAGQTLTEQNVYFENRPLDPRATPPAACDAVLGAKARKTLMPGQLIQSADVEAAAQGNAFLVRNREPVRLVVRIGGLTVTAAGVAMQDGRQGQLIQVQNVDSKKTIVGRVTGANLVEIE